jgi:hypothetical protein
VSSLILFGGPGNPVGWRETRSPRCVDDASWGEEDMFGVLASAAYHDLEALLRDDVPMAT